MNELAQCAGEAAKIETAKELLESMGVILEGISNEVRMIADAVYRGGICNKVDEVPDGPKVMPPMIVTMKEQRDMARDILRALERIREALW